MGSMWLPLAALLPLAVGPLPIPAQSITAQLCGGGSVTIPLKRDAPEAPPCRMKGCHAGACRKRFDLRQ